MLKKILLFVPVIVLLFMGYFFFVGKAPVAERITWGVNFSQKHAELMGLNWQEAYLALLDDLGAKDIKLISHWDRIELKEAEYDFTDLDWQIQEAEKREARVLLVVGMKTGRWPECHLPGWARDLDKKEQQERILNLLEKIVLRYRDRVSVWAWQVENEPLFPFGECPWTDKNFLKKEVALVKSLDTRAAAKGEDEGKPRRGQTSSTARKRPIIISDSGEFSLWLAASQIGDIVGTTMYRRVWFPQIKTDVSYSLPPVFYWRKAQIVRKIFDKDVIVVELQAEPWLAGPEKTMSLEQFKNNIEFARSTGLKEFYLWGSEWWYWLKEKQNEPEIWNEAKKLFHL